MALGARTEHSAGGQFRSAQSPERHESEIELHHKHVARSYARGGTNPWEERPAGPLTESIPTAYLPEYIIGRTPMPKRCPDCGCKVFATDEIGGGATSRLLCGSPACGRQVGWIVGNVTMTRRSTAAPRVPSPENPKQIAGILGFDLMEGCEALCTSQTGHDPEVHEEYGKRQAVIELQETPAEPFRSGLLYIDFEHRIYRVDGQDIKLYGITERLLRHYATRAPHVVSYEEATQIGWNVAEVDVQKYRKTEKARFRAGEVVKSWGNLHTQILRVRQKLGDAAGLLESISGSGHRLKLEPVREGIAL